MRRTTSRQEAFALSVRRPLTLLLALAGALLVVAPAVAGGGPDAQPPTDQILVRLAAGASLDASALDATAGVKLKQVRKLSDGSYVLKLPKRLGGSTRCGRSPTGSPPAATSSRPSPTRSCSRCRCRPTRAGRRSGTCSPLRRGNYGIDLPGARDITLGSSGITIGVIDTGYRPHIDLTGRFVGGYDFIGDVRVANDGNGRDSDALDPGDWITSAENASGYFVGCGVSNSSWHGTHVSGTIGAVSDNGIGVAGINQVSKIQPLRVLGKCGGYTSDIADAIRWSAGLPVTGIPNNNPTPDRVVNISLGGSGAVRLGHAERDQRRRRSGHGRGRRCRQQQRERVELHPGQLQQRDHGRRDRATREAARTTRTTAPRSRSRRRAATRSSARRSSRRSTPAPQAPGRRLVRELPGHEHGDAARRRHRLADAVGEPVADAGAGDDDAAVDRDAVPAREAPARRRRAAQASSTPPRRSRRRRAAAGRCTGRVRQDLARESGIDRRHVGDA